MSDRGRYSKWVYQYVGEDQWVKRLDGQYCLFGIESGKEVLLGFITREGLLESDEQALKRTSYVYEYGASKALWALCPSKWKTSMGDGWEQYLLFIISEISPTSYLLSEVAPERPSYIPHLARKKLDLFLVQECGFSIREIYSKLNTVRLIIDKRTKEQRFSDLSEAQAAFARALNLTFELEVL